MRRMVWSLVIALILISGWTTQAQPASAPAVQAQQSAATATPRPETPIARYLMEIYSGGRIALSTLTATAWPTWTPTATAPPVITASSTPTPSTTPTSTPTAPATNTAIPSPPPTFTQIPSATPAPTQTPYSEATQETTPPPTEVITPLPPLPKTCRMTAITNIRVRSGPSLQNAIIASWPQGSEREFDRFNNEDRGYLWGHHAEGWSAVYDKPANYWFVGGSQSNLACFEVEGWPGYEPPKPIARPLDGFHLLVGTSEVVLNWLSHVGTLKGLDHSDKISLMAKAIDPRIVIVYRSLRNANGVIDGPLAYEQHSADIYYNKTQPFWVPGFDYYEFVNEWGFESRAVEADFNIAMLELMGRHGYCGLAFSAGPGNPEFPAWDEWIRVLRWIDDHPCGRWPDGTLKYHGVALHQSGHMPDSVETLANSYTKNPWIYARVDMVNDYLIANHHYSLQDDFRGPVYITEMGFEDYTNPNEHFSCEEAKAGLDLTRKEYRASGIIDGFHLWNFTTPDSFRWVDLTGCLPVFYS